MRRIINVLRPTLLDELGLRGSLECHIAQFSMSTGIKCKMDYMLKNDNEAGLSVLQSTHLYRILQEALTNVKKHSHASKVAVELHGDDGIITMSISDNGRGVPVNHITSSNSYGLLGMKERVVQQGGEISFGKPPCGGFSVTVQIPLSAASRTHATLSVPLGNNGLK